MYHPHYLAIVALEIGYVLKREGRKYLDKVGIGCCKQMTAITE